MNHKTTAILTLSVLFWIVFGRATQAKLMVTEIMSESLHSGDLAFDWWELTNTGRTAVNLAGYSWDDGHQRPGQNTLGNITLLPGESLVVIDNPQARVRVWKEH